MLLGRQEEQREIELALAQARAGTSATLALVGEPGIGKTALLEYAAERAGGMAILRARGVESEAEIPFASLLELLRPALGLLDSIPEPQATALEGALALRPGVAQERFAVGAATLSLLAAFAEREPVLVIIDDAHWLDRSSAQALLFAVRRLIADPVAVVLAVREGEPSLLEGADLRTLTLDGLTVEHAAVLLDGLDDASAARLHGATAGNPLAMLELATDPGDLALAPGGAPLLVSARISRAFMRRSEALQDDSRRALVLAATSDSGDLVLLERAARTIAVDLSTLAVAEAAGLLSVGAGVVEFRHPLVRSAVYADASAEERREAHRALAAALPDRDIDRRAWHLALAAVGVDEPASAALEQVGARGRERTAYATSAAAFERAGRLAADRERRGRLLRRSADSAWLAGDADRAIALLDEARADTVDQEQVIEIDSLAGHIATRTGSLMRGHEILVSAASRAGGERAVEMLAEAATACLFAANPTEMLAVAEQALAQLPERPSTRARFISSITLGMARIVGGDAGAGAAAIHEGVTLAEGSAELRDDLSLVPWMVLGPMFLRQSGSGRVLLEHAIATARAHAAVGALTLVLVLVARDHATTDRWAIADATYREAIDLARESGQQTALVACLAGLAWLLARRGQQDECRAAAGEALAIGEHAGTRFCDIWATAALGDLELGLGNTAEAVRHFERQQEMLRDLAFTDADLSPAPDLVDAYIRLGRESQASRVAAEFVAGASSKGQPWSLARAMRCQGQLADDASLAGHFELALTHHARTLDVFETARTRLAYGERLRRARNRVLARVQLRAALVTFEALDARPWTDRARSELAASGETIRRRDPSTIDELTPRELQIALELAGGKTTREAAAAMFLSPKTIEYHLRHVYDKLGIRSRQELAERLGERA